MRLTNTAKYRPGRPSVFRDPHGETIAEQVVRFALDLGLVHSRESAAARWSHCASLAITHTPSRSPGKSIAAHTLHGSM